MTDVSLKRILSKILQTPLIIETGTTSNTSGEPYTWTWRKWSDGTAECWCYYSKNIAANTADNNNYINYPFTFTAKPIVTLGLHAGGADLYRGHIESGSSTNTQVRLTLINKHTAAVSIGMYIHAIGQWK